MLLDAHLKAQQAHQEALEEQAFRPRMMEKSAEDDRGLPWGGGAGGDSPPESKR